MHTCMHVMQTNSIMSPGMHMYMSPGMHTCLAYSYIGQTQGIIQQAQGIIIALQCTIRTCHVSSPIS